MGLPGSGLAPHVLVVDDDPSIRQMLLDYLGDYDFKVSAVTSGAEMTEVLTRCAIDLLVLDVRLPDDDGIQIARRLREQSDLAIIVITGRRDEADRVMALELGADDYLTKPFSPRELLARVRALLRRYRMRGGANPREPGVRAYRFAGWELNVGLRRLTSPQGEVVALSNGEYNLLTAFLGAPQRVLTRAQLLELSRLHDDEVYDRSIDVKIGRLRRKLESEGQPSLIRTDRGAGYTFIPAVEILR
ncbi:MULTISPECIES: response regulator [unclassified Variovorax]|uniref:response regulator n=1 Tax=unclassified Variovorax TaxID=663243 RepID=UPI00076C09A7|nr:MULTISPECIES: response regulator [unclassified Variovorax]KWT94137.1 two component transcriptional regulator, winged helix family [Variovorax sp. WDL1]PNG59904.1 Aerobic respiration control protein ArcA [Variovorax sp. B4]PNG60305.1 Aerobic respiration control protein ArcA [Variovorax sp. B2]VTV13848.1 Dye resistance protein [Variovorax sp. WDL1]